MIEPTQEQKRVIDATLSEDNIYINAGPGSGKTTVLLEITKVLLRDSKNSIVLITFTNKAAKNITEKVLSGSERIESGTFHKISYNLMKRHGHAMAICDEGKKKLIIKGLFNCRKDREVFSSIYKKISKEKSNYPVTLTGVTKRYQEELQRYRMLDFDDIINHGTDLIHSTLASMSITHILVDELQDTSQNQLEFLKALQKVSKCKMIGVSDSDQGIFEWRFAKPKNVEEFISTFSCKIYQLGTNFRSKNNIVKHSRILIEHNKERLFKDLRSFAPENGKIEVYKGYSPYDEIDFIIEVCLKYPHRDIAILYRDRINKPKLEYGLVKAGIRYSVSDSNEVVERSAFRTLLSILKIAAGIYDVYDLEQASKGLKRIGKTTLDKIKKKLEEGSTIEEAVQILKRNSRTRSSISIISDLEGEFKRLNSESRPLSTLIEILPKYTIQSFDISPGILEFLIEISRTYYTTILDIREMCNDFGLNNKEEIKEDTNIILSTIHSFKGLEKDIVIVPFCNWELRPDENTENITEAERRLFYVAITRAKNNLYLTYTGLVRPRFIREMKC